MYIEKPTYFEILYIYASYIHIYVMTPQNFILLEVKL